MRYYCNSYKLLRAIVTLCLGEYVVFFYKFTEFTDVVLSFFLRFLKWLEVMV